MGQFQDTIFTEYPVVIRDVTAAQFIAQTKGAPRHPGIRYRVDGLTEYQWLGGQWVATASMCSSVGELSEETASVDEIVDGLIHKTILTFVDTPITINDDAGVAQYGGVLAYTFPKGLIATFGTVVSGDVTAGVTGTVTDAWEGDVSIGTAIASTGSTLTATEADIMASAEVSAGADDTIGAVSAASSSAATLDGRTESVKVYLNFLIDDDASHTEGTATFTGSITLTWINLSEH